MISDSQHYDDTESVNDEGALITPRNSPGQCCSPPTDVEKSFVKHPPFS